jgi:hypothetical protein
MAFLLAARVSFQSLPRAMPLSHNPLRYHPFSRRWRDFLRLVSRELPPVVGRQEFASESVNASGFAARQSFAAAFYSLTNRFILELFSK